MAKALENNGCENRGEFGIWFEWSRESKGCKIQHLVRPQFSGPQGDALEDLAFSTFVNGDFSAAGRDTKRPNGGEAKKQPRKQYGKKRRATNNAQETINKGTGRKNAHQTEGEQRKTHEPTEG